MSFFFLRLANSRPSPVFSCDKSSTTRAFATTRSTALSTRISPRPFPHNPVSRLHGLCPSLVPVKIACCRRARDRAATMARGAVWMAMAALSAALLARAQIVLDPESVVATTAGK